MNDSTQTALVHNFEVLLRYAVEHKVMLTPKQQCIPVRHIKNMMEKFQVKEPHEEKAAERIYKKRHEMEYRRFYFLDLLAPCGKFLTIKRTGRLTKGRNWQKFFEAPEAGRPFYLFCTFRAGFNVENWFLRGGSFGESISFLVGIEKKLLSFMLQFSLASGSRARVELQAAVRLNASCL